MRVTQVGDLVTFKGTEVKLEPGQRLDRLRHELERVRQGQCAARTLRSQAGTAGGRRTRHQWLAVRQQLTRAGTVIQRPIAAALPASRRPARATMFGS
jgi:hypothetical protein